MLTVSRPGATWRIRAFKRGAGTWTEVAAGTGPLISAGSGATGAPLNFAYGCPTYIQDPLDSSRVIFAYADAAAAQLALGQFDMAAETFSTISASALNAPIANGIDITIPVGGDNGSDDTGAKACLTYRAADNSLLVMYQGTPESVVGPGGAQLYSRPYITAFNRTTLLWSVVPLVVYGTGLASHFLPLGVVVEPDSTAHLIFTQNARIAGTIMVYSILHAAVDPSSLVAHAPDTATLDVRLTAEPCVSYPVIRSVSGGPAREILVAFVSADPLQVNRRAKIVRGAPALAMTWAEETISAASTDSPIGNDFVTPGVGIGPDGLPYVFWVGALNATFSYTFFYSVGGNAGSPWLLPVALLVTDGSAGDFAEFPAVSSLPGLGLAVTLMDFQEA